ncbi:MAG: peptidylprolyl isomerase [Alphaproteobacteria bacterium]
MPITVNGQLIRDEEIAAEMQHHPAPTMRRAVDAAAKALVVRQLLLQEAARLGMAADDENPLDRLLASQIAVPDVDDAACRRYFEANRKRFRSDELYEACHILIAADESDDAGLRRARQFADALIARLQQQPERFAELARAHSDCPSKEAHGNLGQVTRGEIAPELATALAELGERQLCPDPVRTRHGYHVVRLDRRAAPADLPFEAVRERIAAYLTETAWRSAVRQYIGLLAGRAEITGIDVQGWETPLVQ